MELIARGDGGDDTILWIAAPFILVAGLFFSIWRDARQRRLADRWAGENNLRLLSLDECHLFARGPFFLRSGRGTKVFRFSAAAQDGSIRQGWLRCGAWTVSVRWDQEKVEQHRPGFPVIFSEKRDSDDVSR